MRFGLLQVVDPSKIYWMISNVSILSSTDWFSNLLVLSMSTRVCCWTGILETCYVSVVIWKLLDQRVTQVQKLWVVNHAMGPRL